MSFALNWLIDSATAGTLLSATGLLVLPVLRRAGLKQRWGEAIIAACMMAALLALIPGRPQLSLSLIHLGSNPPPRAGIAGHQLHIGPLAVRAASSSAALPEAAAQSGSTNHTATLATSLIHRLTAYFGAGGLWWLPIIYLCGVLFMVARVAIGQWILWRLRATAWPATAAAQQQWNKLLDHWRNFRFSRRPRLLVAPNIRSPMTFGIWRPVVLIPRGLCDGPNTLELQAVLLHELAHIRRRDALTDAVAVIVGVFFFYQPLLWWLRRKVRLYREYVADQQAAKGMASPDCYANCLLELARSRGPLLEWPRPATPLLGSHSEFYRRMRQLLRHPTPPTCESTAQVHWLLGTAITMAIVTATITLRAGAGVPLWSQSSMMAMADIHANAAHTAFSPKRSTFNPAVLVERGTAYLLRHQGPQGQWLGRYGPAVTALVVKALVVSGHSLTSRPVRSALTFIESCRRSDGGFYSNVEPIYNTAIVLRTLSSLSPHRFRRQIDRGLHFLQSAQAVAAPAANHPGTPWLNGRSLHVALNDELTMEALRGAGLPAGDAAVQQALAMLRRNSARIDKALDPQERSADEILQNYGLLTYAQLKSMIYAGLSRNDPRVQRLVHWIRRHYTLKVNPDGDNSRGRYYYYLTFAKALRAYGSATITDAQGVKHHWRRELYRQLAPRRPANGSWANHRSSAYLEGNPLLATTYAVLTLEQLQDPRR
ncbi:MAG: hypothetical protein HKL95_04960 [Phycisphaerae bacterium]|nr:hypothetical protein [Phycisphaerae bacterium]